MAEGGGSGVTFSYALTGFSFGLGGAADVQLPLNAAEELLKDKAGEQEEADGPQVGASPWTACARAPCKRARCSRRARTVAQVLRSRIGGGGAEEGGGDVQAAAPAQEGAAQQQQQPEEDDNPGEFIEMQQPSKDAAAGDAAAQASVAAGAGDALSAEQIAELGRRPYWMRVCRNIKSPFLRLHQGARGRCAHACGAALAQGTQALRAPGGSTQTAFVARVRQQKSSSWWSCCSPRRRRCPTGAKRCTT